MRIQQEYLRVEKENAELEATNLLLEKKQLENERANLKELLIGQTGLEKPLQKVIKDRLDMLNGLLAKEITNNKNYAKQYHKCVELIHNNKAEFMKSTRLALSATHPKFMDYLEQYELTDDEINYICLYAIGLRGKEVGEYIQIKRHYNVSSEIRKKLKIDEHETNIGLYIRKKLAEY